MLFLSIFMQNGAHKAPFGSHFGDFLMIFLRCAVYVIFENSPAIIIDLQVWESQKVSYFSSLLKTRSKMALESTFLWFY